MTAKLSPETGPSALVAENPLGPQQPSLVLFGDDGGRSRAAWFDAADAEAATTAAATMRLRALPLANDAGRDLAVQLTRGRVLPSGRAFVPFAKRALYIQLVTLAGAGTGLRVNEGDQAGEAPVPDTLPSDAEAMAASAAKPTDAERAVRSGNVSRTEASGQAEEPLAPRPGAHLFVGQPRPQCRAEIGLGSVVLAHEGPSDGWWEAEVIGANGSTFSLRWCDYPTQPTVLRKADELALLPPGEL
ncbi:hypothetical protein ACN9MF_23435 [Methylobacterium fujisawaense]|uniref:hypothetical protein n=1 Tax=Methylobacterium fujisawaense TaxID=107400 RepID=UPI003CFAEAC7